MNISSRLGLLLLGCFFVTPARAPADFGSMGADAENRQRSHRTMEGTTTDAEADLVERLGKARALRDARKLAEDILKKPDQYKVAQDLERLKRKFKEQGKSPDLNDPELQEVVRKVLEQHKQ